jgi:hypothetical protein
MVASIVSDYVLALLAALGSILGSTWAIKAIIKHEMKQCDLRMEAFREGLKHSEKNH